MRLASRCGGQAGMQFVDLSTNAGIVLEISKSLGRSAEDENPAGYRNLGTCLRARARNTNAELLHARLQRGAFDPELRRRAVRPCHSPVALLQRRHNLL